MHSREWRVQQCCIPNKGQHCQWIFTSLLLIRIYKMCAVYESKAAVSMS